MVEDAMKRCEQCGDAMGDFQGAVFDAGRMLCEPCAESKRPVDRVWSVSDPRESAAVEPLPTELLERAKAACARLDGDDMSDWESFDDYIAETESRLDPVEAALASAPIDTVPELEHERVYVDARKTDAKESPARVDNCEVIRKLEAAADDGHLGVCSNGQGPPRDCHICAPHLRGEAHDLLTRAVELVGVNDVDALLDVVCEDMAVERPWRSRMAVRLRELATEVEKERG